MENTITFDWAGFTEDDFIKCEAIPMDERKMIEDNIYGNVHAESLSYCYIADIHNYYYTSKDRGYDLEMYMKDLDMGGRTRWIGSIQVIHTARDHKSFIRRAEKLITGFIAEWEANRDEYIKGRLILSWR